MDVQLRVRQFCSVFDGCMLGYGRGSPAPGALQRHRGASYTQVNKLAAALRMRIAQHARSRCVALQNPASNPQAVAPMPATDLTCRVCAGLSKKTKVLGKIRGLPSMISQNCGEHRVKTSRRLSRASLVDIFSTGGSTVIGPLHRSLSISSPTATLLLSLSWPAHLTHKTQDPPVAATDRKTSIFSSRTSPCRCSQTFVR